MAAIRFARAATGRTKFVMFEGSYHGWSDGTLALPSGVRNSVAMARGIGAGAMEDVVVLEYGSPESLKTIANIGSELAAVLVEPVQSRRPDLQPLEFLRELRQITRGSGTALIFDEIIVGFRVHPGGAQVWSGIEADLVTYGKILGGGLPIGAVAGRSRFMDTVDGGQWRYGDDSAPSVPTTFFGGTFNKNPLSMAAADAVLAHLEQQGPELQRNINEQVNRLADDFNAFCRREGFPLKIVHFASLFRFIGEGEYSLQRFPLPVDLFFHLMALKGVYILETRVCFLSTRHADADVQFILNTACNCLTELRGAGFFPRAAPQAASSSPPPMVERLLRDAKLDDAIAPARDAPRGETGEVLLTGCTGFLGAYLLRELMVATKARVHCLVRARSEEEAQRRLCENLRSYDCWADDFAERLVVVPSDLSQPRLGLDPGAWDRLAQRIEAIYHSGAFVNSILPYERLKTANVDGTVELLRLAVDARLKAFHHVSSDAVFDAWGYHRQGVIYEDEPLAHADSLYGGGYAESKWVADKLVEAARSRGISASIYRPGVIGGDTDSGAGRLDDFFARFVKGIVQLRICPEIDATIDLAPADYVARTIVQLSLKGKAQTFHLTHPKPVSYMDLVEAIRRRGYDLEVTPYFRWQQAVAGMRYEDGNVLYPLLPVFTESTAPFFRKSRLDVTNTTVGDVNRDLPSIPQLLALYLDRFVELGFLPLPASRPLKSVNG